MSIEKICRNCQSSDIKITPQTFTNGTVHAAIWCVTCGAHNGFAPSVPIAEAVMPFGKHKGVLLTELVRNDLSYVQWLLKSLKAGSLRTKLTTLVSQP